MIFMSQSGLLNAEKEAEWDEWYVEHLRIMLTVDGINDAQRFKTRDEGHPPSLAMYSLTSAAVFEDPYYQKIRGMGPWLPLIDRRFYRRNLFEGMASLPEVPEGESLWVVDRDRADLVLPGVNFSWLKCVDIDLSTQYRGLAVMPLDHNVGPAREAGVAIYLPSGIEHHAC